MIRLLLVCSGVLLFGAIGAFFLFVPPLLIATTLIAAMALLLTGFMLLYYYLCIPVALQPAPPSDGIDRND